MRTSHAGSGDEPFIDHVSGIEPLHRDKAHKQSSTKGPKGICPGELNQGLHVEYRR